MDSSNYSKSEFRKKLNALVDGELSPEDLKKLEMHIQTEPKFLDEYINYIQMTAEFQRFSQEINEMDHSVTESLLWQLLAEEEKTAPKVEIPQEELQRELIQKVVYAPREKRKISKFNLVTFVASAAAILFVVIYAKFIPEPLPSTEIATLVDQMNVQWADSESGFENGRRLWTDEAPLDLKKGVVSIAYDKGAEIVIEGPALFEIERSGVYLEYGRLYSRVSETALGFTVETPNSQFVDLGTEFGVLADINGSAELHVTKGKVQLFAGSKDQPKITRIVTENKAAHYDPDSGRVKKVPISKTKFVRTFNSEFNIVWKGQMELDLADVVGGGNGLGTGLIGRGIDPSTGLFTRLLKNSKGISNQNYHSVHESRWIDGVFVPGGGIGPMTVDSGGSRVMDCPDTSGQWWSPISNGGHFGIRGSGANRHSPRLSGLEYGTKENPSILMHPNTGITFDLNAFRNDFSGGTIRQFTAKCGISESLVDLHGKEVASHYTSDFWILVDGEKRFEATDLSPLSGPQGIQVKLNPEDRFLTLVVVTKAGQDKRRWALFANPTLIMESRK